MSVLVGSSFKVFNNFLNQFINKDNQFNYYCPNRLTGFVISNAMIDWSNSKEVQEEFKDKTYNYFKEVVKYYRPYYEWYKQEYLRDNHYEKLSKLKEDDCSICLEKLETNITELKCEHQFHLKCIESCFEDDVYPNYNKCPLCRRQNKKWFPFYLKVYESKENLIYKNCKRSKNNKEANGLYHYKKCNRGYSTSINSNIFCYICEWETYLNSVEEVYWENGDDGDLSDLDEIDFIDENY